MKRLGSILLLIAGYLSIIVLGLIVQEKTYEFLFSENFWVELILITSPFFLIIFLPLCLATFIKQREDSHKSLVVHRVVIVALAVSIYSVTFYQILEHPSYPSGEDSNITRVVVGSLIFYLFCVFFYLIPAMRESS